MSTFISWVESSFLIAIQMNLIGTGLSNFILFSRFARVITGMPYEEMDGKFYVDHNGSLRTIT